MNWLRVQRKEPFYLGVTLLAAGILLQWLVESTLASDNQIDSPLYIAVISVFRVLIIAVGIFLLVRQPAIVLPKRSDLALLFFSTFLTFVILEIGARMWLNYLATPEQYDRYVLFTTLDAKEYAWTPHPYLVYYPTPNYSKGQTFHNSLGYRGDEFSREKPADVYRIVVLGGSSTYDVSIKENEKIFTAQLERILNEEYDYQNVQVINAGVPGYNSWEILINLEFRVLDLDPDLVIIYEGTNDVHARIVLPEAYQGDDLGRRQAWTPPTVLLWEQSALLRIVSRSMNFTRQVSVDDFVSAPTYMSWPFESRLDENNLDPAEILKENPPTYFQRNLENMIAVAQEHGVEIMFSTWAYSPNLNDYASKDYYQQAFRENNDVVQAVAEEHDIPLFDFAGLMPQDAVYWADGRHVNEAGALEKARLFAEYLHDQGLIDQ